MKNGFTLVELLALIIVISIVALLVFPSIIKLFNQADERNYKEFINTIELAAEVYVSNNSEQFNLSSAYDQVTITLGDLSDAGLYNISTENPETKQKVNRGDKIIITVNDELNKEYVFQEFGG